MKSLGLRFTAIILLTLIAGVFITPWKQIGVTLPVSIPDYKLGLDLHGGVELDYKIDFADLEKRGQSFSASEVTEGLKSIVEKRVNSLGTAEPTIATASYGGESHIIVQIPTQSFGGEILSESELKKRNTEYINTAKDTIGKVVRLEFKEQKTTVTDEDRKARRDIANDFKKEVTGSGVIFSTIAKKTAQNIENVFVLTGSSIEKEKLPGELSFSGFTMLSKTGISEVLNGETPPSFSIGANNEFEQVPGEKIFVVANITGIEKVSRERDVPTSTGSTSTGATKKETYQTTLYSYEAVVILEKPSLWTPAKTADGKVLDEKYLTRAGVSFNQGFTAQIDLIFNEEGKAIFGELTKRLIGKPIAIYVGGEQLTAPTVQTAITDGHAVITGNYTPEAAKELANNINTGIVPAPIYLTSERAIDAKIGKFALEEIVIAGLVGLVAIMIFLVIFYRISGLLAGAALVIYAILLLALVKMFGIVLTLAGIAGIILSIGLAIDANILIFERTREALREGMSLQKAILSGFGKSWTAIWDSHITSLSSAIVLYIFGVSLIKGFGLALGLGIVLSLFTAMWVSRILILFFGQSFEKNTKAFIGEEQK